MKRAAILLTLLLLAADALAQTAGAQVAQAGGSPPGSAAVGATIPTANTGGGSGTVAVIGLGVAGFAAAAFGYSSGTASNH